jgi:hypothetical protein
MRVLMQDKIAALAGEALACYDRITNSEYFWRARWKNGNI